MKIRKTRNCGEVIKNLSNSESAASTVIAAVLLLSILFTIFAVIRIAYVPEWKADAEQSHMSEIQKDMTELKSTVDMIIFLTATNTSYSARPPLTIPFSMGGGEISILEPSKSSGTLSVNTESYKMTIIPTVGNETSINSSIITYHSNNRQFVDQVFRYENGAVILVQGDRSLMTQFPSLFSINQISAHNYNVLIQAINLSGNSDSISSEIYTYLRLTGNHPNTIDLGNINSFDCIISTKYPDAWKSYFKGNLNEISKETGLKYGTDFVLDPKDYSDKVFLKFLAGSKNQNHYRLSIREYVITAEIGARNSFN
jgi:hypothetical protein